MILLNGNLAKNPPKPSNMSQISLHLRKNAPDSATKYAVMAKLTDVLAWWVKRSGTDSAVEPIAIWIAEVGRDADYVNANFNRVWASFMVEVRIRRDALDQMARRGLISDFTQVLLRAEHRAPALQKPQRIAVYIHEFDADCYGVGLAADDSAPSALNDLGPEPLSRPVY